MTSSNQLFAVVTLPICAAVLLAGAGFASAGDLNPPAGPVAPTMKTLSEVEPRIAINAANTPGDADSLFKITQPGSYYLTGNITGVADKHGIEIVASGVTLDLNGFDLLGVSGSLDGVSITVASQTNIAVVNGSVRSWGGYVVDLFSSNTSFNCRVEGVLASGNGGSGIAIGFSSTVTNCSTYQNAGAGIGTTNACTVTNCSAYQNSGIGIAVLIHCTVANCSVISNGGNGISNGGLGSCTVTDCSVRLNAQDGILCGSGSVIRGNTCDTNGGAGIHVSGGDCRIEGNNCVLANRGIDVDGAGNIIVRNTCSGNSNNWEVVAGNVIPVVNATAAGAVNGDSGGTAPGSTDPNANFTY